MFDWHIHIQAITIGGIWVEADWAVVQICEVARISPRAKFHDAYKRKSEAKRHYILIIQSNMFGRQKEMR